MADSPEITISQCTGAEAAEVAALDARVWGDWANPMPLYRQLVDLFPRAVFVARDAKKQLVGYSVGLFNAETRKGWLLCVDLDESARGKGVGRALVEAVLHNLRTLGAASVTAIIDPNNIASRALFSKLGFELHGLERDYFGEGVDQERWVLEEGRKVNSN